MILIVNGGDSEVLLPAPLLDTVAVKKSYLCSVMNLPHGHSLPICKYSPMPGAN